MTRKLISFGVDLDGVVANFTERFILIAHALFNTPLTLDPALITHWHFEDWYPITKEQVREVWKVFSETPNIWETLRPLDVEGMRYFLNTLVYLQSNIPYSFRLDFITHRHHGGGKSIESQSEIWLRRYFNNEFLLDKLDWNVIQTDKKGEVSVERQTDFFIDDLPANCFDVFSHNPTCKVFLRSRRWNLEDETMWSKLPSNATKLFVPVKDLKEFTDLVVSQLHEVKNA